MQAKVLQENLAKALAIASRFSSSKVQLPVLANILITAAKNKLLISSTNLETSVCLTVGAKVVTEGSVTVPARTLTDLVSNVGAGQLDLSADKEKVVIKASNFSSSILGMNPSDFPVVPQAVEKGTFDMSASDFSDALSKVLFSVSADETRPVLTGALLMLAKDSLSLVSTDGFRLSRKTLPVKSKEDDLRVILPKNTLSEILRLASGEESLLIALQKEESQAIFGLSDIVLTSRVIEGEFPDYEKILPKKSDFKLTLGKEDLLRAVKLASVFARDAANVIKMSVGENLLAVSAESSQSGEQRSEVDIKVDGDVDPKMVFAFNYRFIEEFLGVCVGEEVVVELSDPNSPAVFLDTKDKDFLHIIMPVRLQS